MLLQFGSLFAHWMRFSYIFFWNLFFRKFTFDSEQYIFKVQHLHHFLTYSSPNSVRQFHSFTFDNVYWFAYVFFDEQMIICFQHTIVPFSMFKSAFFTIHPSFECWLRFFGLCFLFIELLWFVFFEFFSLRYISSMFSCCFLFIESFLLFNFRCLFLLLHFFSCWLSICMQTSWTLAFDSIHYLIIIVSARSVHSLDLC